MTQREIIQTWIKTGIGEPPFSVSGGKVDEQARAAEKSQAAFAVQLQSAFQQQFAQNQSTLNFLNGKLTAAINNPTGFSPEALAAAKTGVIQQTATDYTNASRAVNGQIAARGGSTLPSGVTAQIEGGLAQGAANEESSNLNQITLANEQQKQSNYWNAVRGLSGVAAAYDPTGFASSENSSAGTVAGLSQAVSESNKAGFLNNFANAFGSTLGTTLGGGNAGKVSGGGAQGFFG